MKKMYWIKKCHLILTQILFKFMSCAVFENKYEKKTVKMSKYISMINKDI